jgi:hypothetical protein
MRLDRRGSSLASFEFVIVRYFLAWDDGHAKDTNITDIILATITELLPG